MTAAERYDEAMSRAKVRYDEKFIAGPSLDELRREECIAAIEAAATQERTRCVVLARAIGALVHDSHTDQTIYDHAFRACGRDIAEAIERGE